MQIKENLNSNNSLRCPHQLDRYIHFYFMVYMFPTLGSSQRYHCTAVIKKFREWVVGFVGLLYYVHGKHLRSCRDGQLT